jgi:hypothetical protein
VKRLTAIAIWTGIFLFGLICWLVVGWGLIHLFRYCAG